MKNQGLLITFEGGEGAGKTTLIAALAAKLKDRGLPCLCTREPGGTPLGERLRSLLLEASEAACPVGNKAELLLFLAGRAQQLEEIVNPALATGKIVLSDRFNDSTVAYQGAARGLGANAVQQLCDWVCGPTVPAVTFLLDLPVEEGFKRAARRQLDRMETEAVEFHCHVREAFRDLAHRHPQRIVLLDAAAPPEVVLEAAWQQLMQRYGALLSPR
jgi:dTMP kinase